MKKLFPLSIITVVFAFAFLFIGSCENNTQITEPNQQSMESIDQQLDELEEGVAELTLPTADSNLRSVNNTKDGTKGGHCCNNTFPLGDPNGNSNLKVCANDPPPELGMTKKQCAMTWAKYNTVPHTALRYKACGGTVPWSYVPNITGLTKSQSGNKPYFYWNFMYCHKYRIEKKVGSGSWTHFDDVDPLYPNSYPTTQNFRDTSVNLNTITQNISYRVRGDIFSSYSSNGQVIVYTPPPVTVTIGGPTHLTTTQTGTFTANASYGVPSTYTYSWSKFQYCNDRSQSNNADKDDGTRSVPCGYWRPISGNTSTVYVSGSIPAFRLKVTVTDMNSSAYDYYNVNVTLP